MKISMICFSLTGLETQRRLLEGFEQAEETVKLFTKSKYIPGSITESCGDWTGTQFKWADAIVFIGACGIAVRSIAPYVQGKKTDPAVLVVDECGKFVISLLSGHLGGANELTLQAAEILGAQPVITTATDLHRRFAVDVFAKKNNCSIFHMKAAKEVSAALLAGEAVGFYSEFPWKGELPQGLVLCDRDGKTKDGRSLNTGVCVTVHKDCLPFGSTTQVVPKAVTLGMGCRKGKEAEVIREKAMECLRQNNLYQEALEGLASIDVKKEEPGLLALAQAWDIPFDTGSEAELMEVPGAFNPSSFVKETVGVDNVCERSAVLKSGFGKLIQKKLAGDGVTLALAVRNWRICFE